MLSWSKHSHENIKSLVYGCRTAWWQEAQQQSGVGRRRGERQTRKKCVTVTQLPGLAFENKKTAQLLATLIGLLNSFVNASQCQPLPWGDSSITLLGIPLSELIYPGTLLDSPNIDCGAQDALRNSFFPFFHTGQSSLTCEAHEQSKINRQIFEIYGLEYLK